MTAVFFLANQVHVLANPALPTKTPLGEQEALVGSSATSTAAMILQTIFVLALMIGFIYLLLRFLGKRSTLLFGKSFIRTLGGCSLGPQKTLQVVQVGDSLYIVGVGESVNLIRHINDPEEVQALLASMEAQYEEPAPSIAAVGSWMKQLRKRRKGAIPDDFEAAFQLKIEEAKQRREMMEEELFDDRENGNKK